MSKIKFLKSTAVYEGYLNYFFKKYPLAIDASYMEHYNTLMYDAFSWADFWKINLEKTEKFIVEEIIINDEYLQKKWAEEHNVTYSKENWILDILEKQIDEFKPDVWFSHDLVYIKPEFRKMIVRKNKNIKLVLGWDGIALNNYEMFVGCDVMLSCLESVADFYSQYKNMQGYFFPFGFDNSILGKLKVFNNKFPVSFVGSLFLSEGCHWDRFQLISELISKIPLNIWVSSFRDHNTFNFIKEQIDRLKKMKFRELYNIFNINLKNRGEAYGIDMYNILANSEITLNSHIDSAGTKGGNIRLFEATGVGTCLVTDWKENLHEYFELDKEIVVYKSSNECIDKIRYLLNHDSIRQRIADAGRNKTISNFSFGKRILDFSRYLEKFI